MPPASTRTFAARLSAESSLQFLAAIRDRLPAAEFFLVGGAVRDIILGRPTKDWDLLARNVRVGELSSVLAAMGEVDVVGRDFGVLKFREAGQVGAVDIAWPRTERAVMSGAYRDVEVHSDPRLPVETDLGRRDFTVNAMAWSFGDKALIDPFGGMRDSKAKTLRAVGEPEQRFAEDYTRMLRCIRFACQLRFSIEDRTWSAMRKLAHHVNSRRDVGGISEFIVPRELVARELTKAFLADPVRALDLFDESGMLALLLPELTPMRGCSQPKNFHSEGDVWTHTRLALSRLADPAFAKFFGGERVEAETVMAVLFHDVGKPLTAIRKAGTVTYYGHPERGAVIAKDAAERLRLSSAEGMDIDPERLAWLVTHHLLPNLVDLDEVRPATLAKYFLFDPVAGRRLLHLSYADASASLRPNGKSDLRTLRALMKALDKLRKMIPDGKPERLLTGDEVMELTGLNPGPAIGRILEKVQEAHLDGAIASADDAMEFVRRLEREREL